MPGSSPIKLTQSPDEIRPNSAIPRGRPRLELPESPAEGRSVGGRDYDPAMPLKPTRSVSDEPVRAYKTDWGEAWLGDSIETLQNEVEDESIDLIMTSPPFALQRPKEYGNESQEGYKAWFLPFADEFWRVLKPTGSLVIDLGGAWEGGQPVKSIYQFELLVSLCRRPVRPFVLAQDFYWYNPARLPSPAQWVTVERVRVKDSVNYVWWLSKTPHPKADNTRVLREYTDSMKKLISSGKYNRGRRRAGHTIGEGFNADRGGAIPPNLLAISNTGNDKGYLEACDERGIRAHPARFPRELPEFFVRFLTEPGDVVLDPFAGSNTTGAVAEDLERRWLSIDIDDQYLRGSIARFEGPRPTPLKPGQMQLDVDEEAAASA
jgi:site-specific DNA-methyltransferase (cytosine-N4-specific)